MSLIEIRNLTFTYPGSLTPVFDHLSLQLDTNWRIGFVGRNGRGKTTLLKLLAGELEDGGSIRSQTDFRLFPFPLPHPDQTVGELLSNLLPHCEEWQIGRELGLLQLPETLPLRPFSSLSQGEQSKVLLAALFLKEDAFLLIDEPTNHLEGEGREVVADYLGSKRGFLLVSHDRTVLDRCTTHTLAINKTGVELQRGSFSVWYENKQARDRLELAQNRKLKGEMDRLELSARRAAGWSDKVEQSKKGRRNSGLRPDRGYLGHKSAKMMKRSKSIADRRQTALEEKSGLLKDVEQADSLKLSPLPYHSRTLLSLREVVPQYDGCPVCAPVTFSLTQGERICLSGKNGSGKSSLLKLLLGEDISHSGEVQIGSQLKISVIPQDTAHLSGSLRQLAAQHGLEESLFKSVLRKLDFTREQLEQPMEILSMGQKKKVLLAQSLCTPAHLYLWDEPLNYIDLLSRIQIEELLLACRPTLIFVEHDSAFRQKIATRTLSLFPPKETETGE